MAKKVLSIVIGTECTKVCEVSYKKNYKNKGIRVYRTISFPTPEGTIEDGYIQDKETFGEELRNRLKAAKIKSDKVIFSVTSSKIANREVMIPPVKEKKVMDIIKTGASDYFPIDLKEYILSYLILEKKTSNRKQKAMNKKLNKEERKLAKKLAKTNKRRLKKSKTEMIANNMDLMEEQKNEQIQANGNSDSSVGGKNIGKKYMRLSVYAAPATLVKNYYNFANMMNFDIVAIDYSGNSSYQMIKRQANRGTNVFVQFNELDTLISILQDDVLILQRTVGYGVSTLAEAVMEQELYRTKDTEEAIQLLTNRNLLTPEQESANRIQFDFSWSKGEAAAASEYVRAVNTFKKKKETDAEIEARSNICESLHFLTSSIARMLDYYKSNHKDTVFDTVYLSGTGIRIQGIDSFFFSEIGINHKKMEKLWTVSAKKKAVIYRENPSEYISCIGAVIKPIDFIPLEYLEKQQKRSAIVATIIISLACLIGSVGTVYVSYTDYQTALEELDEVNRQYAAMPQLSGIHREYDQAVMELQEIQNFDDMTDSNNDIIKDVIEELEKKLPSGTVIHSMQFSETGVSMNVTAIDDHTGPNVLIAKLLIQLKTIQLFSDVDISGISVAQEAGIAKVNFTIICTYPQNN